MKKTLTIIMVLISTLLMFGCAKAEIDYPSVPAGSRENNPDQTAMIGKQLPNPYAVDTMRKAYRNLAPTTRSLASESEITPTHIYVKFTPRNIDELNVILAETQLELYLFPLDREVTTGWSSVMPDFSTNGIQNRWSSVPIDYKLPDGCPYEILEELYIPDDYDTEGRNITRAASLSESFIRALVAESMRLCGMEEDAKMVTRAIYRIPSGRILAWDDTRRQHVGNEGMKVRATRLFKTAVGFCNSDGYFECNKSFSESWDYHMHFGRDDFELRQDNTTEIVYNYHSTRSPWNYTFAAGSKESFWSTAFRAAFCYYYKNIDGLSRPPLNSFWKAKLTMKMHQGKDPDGTQATFAGGPRFLGITSAIQVYKQYENAAKKTVDCPTDYLYGSVIHEVAHASHWNLDKDNFKECRENGNKIVLESWTRGVEVQLTRKIYSNYTTEYDLFYRGRYTGMITDLTDGTKFVSSSRWWPANSNTYENNVVSTYTDRVSGILIKDIEACLVGSSTWNQWRDKLKNKYPLKATEINNTFRYWNSRTY